jgi:predicted DNA-binding transcriptional regulator AlpA
MAGSAVPEILSLLRQIRDALASPVEGLGPKEAAQYVGVSVSAWHSMNSRSSCPAPAEISERCPRWSRTELRAWLLAGAPGRNRWQLMRDQALRRAG